MGLFFRKKKNNEEMPSDYTSFGPLLIQINSCESKLSTQIRVSCNIESGRVGIGETLSYKTSDGRVIEVRLEQIESMMMNLKFAMENTSVVMTLSGDFQFLDPSTGDSITR